ncbi:BREX-1 system adenine-specific DNA-methyltransferase PglX [Microbacterium sp. zg.Y625]|uniref:BREX-1 system adenine-specific DNA-methyltransferase PglX n=1 Tax=Microbacterium jiangjiandongii TaxID=3049071 RepID=UPI00214CEF1D|nr:MULTISPECIES: BREX-1 system adenine-specific DNA-methyltransferase PglX [unclassified Microbacterium]MCR2791697.1 BREX-1 system adenine-specific DNA-methyltransferase PglX [Microbacterium sp. zg.Y625]WIM24515.1 BREX-1 system adenine-specific DNA-methyltransferase PglX [Microbacterium sp. zg-Y625]
MNTASLKLFATWARVELVREVGARVAAVLAPGSAERVEEAAAVGALERAIAAAGGGVTGRAKVAERVAYTWFNRIVALRFMDANGYTGIGVVSPYGGASAGQPEVLADAKRGVIDTDVVGTRTAEGITALLDGARPSSDPQGEAYSLLLAEYCRYWHRSMPFMFEREGDYTELLMPANLLADGSVLARAVTVLNAEVCQDVEVIGWLYQFYISELKSEVFAGFKKNKKAGPDEIPAATQLFTPHWIVRYLVENSVGRLWMLNHPESRLVDQMDYYVPPVDEETDFLKISTPEELTVIDPACGSGHMLTYAFDLLYAIYEEQGYAPSEIAGLILTHNLFGTEIDPRAGALAAFALMMKARARQRTFFNKQVKPNICVIAPISFTPDELDYLVTPDGDRHAEEAFWNQFAEADTFGSLIQPDASLTTRLARHLSALDDGGDMIRAAALDWAQRALSQAEYLSRRYAVVVTNPPYMGNGNMSERLAKYLGDRFPLGRSDLMTAFMLRSSDLTAQAGFWAIIDLPAWMVLKSYEKLREQLFRTHFLVCLAQFGRGVWGSDFGSVGFVFQKASPNGRRGSYRKLFERHVDVRTNAEIEALFLDPDYNAFVVDQADFVVIPGSPLVYWLSGAMRRAFSEGVPLSSVAEPRQGLLTGDSGAFVREWWEVSANRISFSSGSRELAKASGARWFPYNKGGEFRKWYGNHEHVVNWEDDGHIIRAFGSEDGGKVRSRPQNVDYYFRSSVSWSNVSSGSPAFRSYPPGFIAAGSTGDGVYPQSEDLSMSILGILNSSVTHELLAALAPTITFNVGTIANLPIILPGPESEIGEVVRNLVGIARADWDQAETSWGFEVNPLVARKSPSLEERVRKHQSSSEETAERVRYLETRNNEAVAELYGLAGDVRTSVELSRVSLSCNTRFRFGEDLPSSEYEARLRTLAVQDLVSYAVGCMFGRFSLDEPGLILADQGATLQDYLARVPSPTFMPDKDDVIPIVDGDWFEDDIVERFRQFLRVAFGEQHFEENLRFVTESLGVKDIRTYFVKSFYKDHVQRYKKRPIYWLFSSPKGSFNALIYMHRYTPSTVSTVLNEYLREFQAKLQASLVQAERSNNVREAERLRKVLVELNEYEHDVLYPLATQQIAIDLDDGVKRNYPKFGAALKKIPGLEASDE